jgi:DNA-binding response OmpR family regulator
MSVATERRIDVPMAAASLHAQRICPGGAERSEEAMESLGRRVLVVDDDDDIANLVEEALSEDGYAVEVLKDSRIEAIGERVLRVRPHCILLDGGIGSGYGDSWESAAVLKGRLPPVPVIMFTAHATAVAEATDNTSGRSQAAGFTALLRKPFELTELMRVIEFATGQVETPESDGVR